MLGQVFARRHPLSDDREAFVGKRDKKSPTVAEFPVSSMSIFLTHNVHLLRKISLDGISTLMEINDILFPKRGAGKK